MFGKELVIKHQLYQGYFSLHRKKTWNILLSPQLLYFTQQNSRTHNKSDVCYTKYISFYHNEMYHFPWKVLPKSFAFRTSSFHCCAYVIQLTIPKYLHRQERDRTLWCNSIHRQHTPRQRLWPWYWGRNPCLPPLASCHLEDRSGSWMHAIEWTSCADHSDPVLRYVQCPMYFVELIQLVDI